jgi:hypothetical protein
MPQFFLFIFLARRGFLNKTQKKQKYMSARVRSVHKPLVQKRKSIGVKPRSYSRIAKHNIVDEKVKVDVAVNQIDEYLNDHDFVIAATKGETDVPAIIITTVPKQLLWDGVIRMGSIVKRALRFDGVHKWTASADVTIVSMDQCWANTVMNRVRNAVLLIGEKDIVAGIKALWKKYPMRPDRKTLLHLSSYSPSLLWSLYNWTVKDMTTRGIEIDWKENVDLLAYPYCSPSAVSGYEYADPIIKEMETNLNKLLR